MHGEFLRRKQVSWCQPLCQKGRTSLVAQQHVCDLNTFTRVPTWNPFPGRQVEWCGVRCFRKNNSRIRVHLKLCPFSIHIQRLVSLDHFSLCPSKKDYTVEPLILLHSHQFQKTFFLQRCLGNTFKLKDSL